MIINFKDITKYFGSDLVLDGASGIIKSNSRIGIIGANGAGKTTLLNIISGVEQYDSGEIYLNPSVKVGYLTQNSLVESEETVYNEMKKVFSAELEAINKLESIDLSNNSNKYEYEKLLSYINSKDAYNIEFKINYILNGMGFTYHQRGQTVSSLSGGERTRLALAKLLLTDCNVLLLDEPTNHLDFTTSAWLEKYLSEYKGAVISVTHDRYYLNKVCNTIWEMEFGKITQYEGNYTKFKETKEKVLRQKEKEYNEYIERQEKLKDYVARNLVRASTSAMAKSRQKELEKMEEINKPQQYNKQININFKIANKSWFDVLKSFNLSLSIDGRKLITDINLDIKYGEKIAFIGENGIGKTTLFNTLLGKHIEYDGKFRWGKEVSIGVYEQNHKYSDQSKTVKDEFWDTFPSLNENQVRFALASVLFTADDIYKKVGDISGGESARLQLAKLTMQFNNVLMMDEPTNHLDMMSKEKLEKALLDFSGTELIISHDRYFLNTVPDKIVYLSKSRVIIFNGKFDEFQKEFDSVITTDEKPKEKNAVKVPNSYKSKEERASQAKKRNEISSIEKQISALELENSKLEEFILHNSTNYEELSKACNSLEQNKKQIDTLTEKWLELSEE